MLERAEQQTVYSQIKNYNFQEKKISKGAKKTAHVATVEIAGCKVKEITNQYWTAKQRQASSLHEVAYRACFKPQLPRFFIELLTKPGDIVYDPFSGRGTTALEAGLLGRNVIANDINPLSRVLSEARLFVPDISTVESRLKEINLSKKVKASLDLSMFYHDDTYNEILNLKNYLLKKKKNELLDSVDLWIQMVATNRLTGHSPGFFSVYTLPPNLAVSAESQTKINKKLRQRPEYRNVKEIILRKTKQLIRNVADEQKRNLIKVGTKAIFLNQDARTTKSIRGNSVQLTVTSPPFLDIVQYAQDNWLRCWFNSLDALKISQNITSSKSVEEWSVVMKEVLSELYRVTKRGGYVAFEVGEVRKKSIQLERHIVPLGQAVGFSCQAILINQQNFTKTANIWGIKNNHRGTNTNRIVLFSKN